MTKFGFWLCHTVISAGWMSFSLLSLMFPHNTLCAGLYGSGTLQFVTQKTALTYRGEVAANVRSFGTEHIFGTLRFGVINVRKA